VIRLVVLVSLAIAGRAEAGLGIRIEAEVGPDLDWVRGTLHIEGDEPYTLVDPLEGMPDPPDDLFALRTFPGLPEHGVVRIARLDENTVAFHAFLPRRFGDVGTTRHGLFANGAWYPQPLVPGGLPIVEWDVTVRIPEGTTGALGDTWGQDVLTWVGVGERASLAVLPQGEATQVVVADTSDEPSSVTLLTRAQPRKVLLRELEDQLGRTAVDGAPWEGVIVEAPLRRRLARGGVGMAYVSDRAYRVTPGLFRFHRVGVTRGVMEGLVPNADPYVRAVAAGGLSVRHAEALSGPDAARMLGWVSWIPTVYGVLHSRRMPFYAEILEDTHPGDPIADDLVERFDPHAPGLAVATQVDDRYGPGTSPLLAEGLVLGLSLDRAATVTGVAPGWLAAWRAPYPEQDYRLEVQREPPLVRIVRDAPLDAPAEAVVVSVDGERAVRLAGPGPDTLVLVPPDTPKHVSFDPRGHTAQTSRLGDAWPRRYHIGLSAAITQVNFTEGYLYGWGSMTLRRAGNTHDVWTGTLFTDDATLIGASLRYTRKEGPLLDGLSRQHRVTFTVTPAALNPRYAEVEEGGWFSLGGAIAWSWQDQPSSYFPMRGHQFAATANGGIVPGTDDRWARLGVGWTGVVSPHPRHAFAVHGDAAVADGTVPHRLLGLGGASNMRSVGTSEVIGDVRGIAMAEYRVVPMRHASVPLGLVWWTELQLSAGVEVGTVFVDGLPKSALGATFGATVLGDALGFEEQGIGVTVAIPAKTWGFVSERIGKPQVYLRWAQAF